MSIKLRLIDAFFGTNRGAGVTSRGQLVVAPLEYNEPTYKSLSSVNTAYNFVVPISGKQFVIDGLFISSDKNVSSTNGAVIEVFESQAPDSIVAERTIFNLDLGKLDKGSISGLNVLTSQGVWINAKTDDATCNLTILGYYVNV